MIQMIQMIKTIEMIKSAPGSMLAVALAVALAAGCAGTKRSPQAYRADTQRVLETRNPQVKLCYDLVLAGPAGAATAGTVTVRFVVEKKTGVFRKATVDPAASSAGEPLIMCVLESLRDLKLDPPDANEGQATFRYELQPATASR
jgi:hypothetical protein